ncbi:major facilitator superfamily domain-containing protein [Xylariaceae sp. FL1272]|nr:major facilitator superfamily domain-containing protein [Xylariaceae sp. FL1272]
MADTQTQIATVAAPVSDVRSSVDQKALAHNVRAEDESVYDEEGHELWQGLVLPTEEEKATLRRVSGKMPSTTYWLCAVEFAERASYYGCNQVYKNFVRAPLPTGINGPGTGAVYKGSDFTAGALGKGSAVASAVTESFKFLAYALPVFFGWLADTKYGRFKMICWGVGICGVAHIIMIISALPTVLQSGKSFGPFAFSLYLLAVGAAQFKPNISPTLIDQSPHKKEHVITDKNGEKVIVDPEASINSVMLWFYLLINIGAVFGIPTTYLAKLVGYWAAYLIPTILYLLLPPLLWYLNPRLIKQPSGGSDLGNVFRVVGDVFAHGGITKIGTAGFWDLGKPSVRIAAGSTKHYEYDDSFVNDVRRTFKACGIFLFAPIWQINDYGLGAAANALTAGMDTNGLPNDLFDNLNSVSIVVLVPIMNHIVYPWMQRKGIKWGSISRITFGFALGAVGSLGYGLLQYYVYKTSPCGNHASTCTEIVAPGEPALSPVPYGLYAIPVVLGGMSEVFVNVSLYGIAYAMSPRNMKGLVASLNLFTNAISAAIGLAAAPAIKDPNLVWVFFGPTIAGGVLTVIFWFTFHNLDEEEFVLNTDMRDMKRDSGVSDEETASAQDKKVVADEKKAIGDEKN